MLQRTAWFPPIGKSATSEAAEEAALQSLSHEQAAVLQAQKKKQVLSELRQRLAKMTGKGTAPQVLKPFERCLTFSSLS